MLNAFTKFRYFTLALAFSLLQSCSLNNQNSELDKLNWLTGRWENTVEGKQTIEIWERQGSPGFLVQGFMLEGTDTIFSENIQVKAMKQEILYLATVPNQNNGQTIPFKLTENDGQKAVFINTKHDFPKKISYIRASENEVRVQLEGTIKGKPVNESYTLKKQPEANQY